MEISEGGEASREYLRVTFGEVSATVKKKVRAALEEFCAQDTMAMVEIAEKLKMLVVDPQ